LIRACYLLRACGVRVQCLIVGDGPERPALQFLIAELQLCETVSLIGAVPRQEIDCYYEMADLVVLTSRSEGIPLVLMEAMARARLVLAPAITGISELVIEGKTGFLYQPEDLEGFVWRVEQIGRSLRALDGVRRGARERVRKHFERTDNLRRFVDAFVERLSEKKAVAASENPVLQQI
jgi:colanic acid/amylovoran biosynthesis glycosyltransferase